MNTVKNDTPIPQQDIDNLNYILHYLDFTIMDIQNEDFKDQTPQQQQLSAPFVASRINSLRHSGDWQILLDRLAARMDWTPQTHEGYETLED